ncbi:MAG: hypothetical protein PHP52_10965 [Bacteroidales bacterium]|nr:hypothetical protein [Bacteroidales bacterium]
MKKILNFSFRSFYLLLFAFSFLLFSNMTQVVAQKTNTVKKADKTTTNKVVKTDTKTTNIDQKTKPVTKVKDDKTKTKPETTTQKPADKTPIDQAVTNNQTQTSDPVYQPIVETLPNGKIDWTEQYVEAKGMSVLDTARFKNPAQAKLMARRGAIVDAQRNLLEIIKGVRVISETKVVDMITESDYIYNQVDGVIKNAQLIGDYIEKDGYLEVTMRVPLYDRNGIAPAISKNLSETSKKSTMGKTNFNFQAGDSTEINTDDISDLIFNFNGQQYSPSMFPIILDENNNILLDYSQFYDPQSGKFPKIVSATKDIINTIGSEKGAQIIDVIESFDGTIKIDNSKISKKINWSKIGSVATTIGKFAMALIL